MNRIVLDICTEVEDNKYSMVLDPELVWPVSFIGIMGFACFGLIAAVKSLTGLKGSAPTIGQSGAAKVVAVSADLRYYNVESPVADCVYYNGLLVRSGKHINACLNVFVDRLAINGPARSLNQIALKDIVKVESVKYEGVAHYMNTPQATSTATGDAPGVQITFRTKNGGWKKALFLPESRVFSSTTKKVDEIVDLIRKLMADSKKPAA